MAMIYIGDYAIDYSIMDGRVRSFDEFSLEYGWVAVDDEEKLREAAKKVAEIQGRQGHGYTVFLYRMEEEGKLELGYARGDGGKS